jgi:hypothetical protein
MALGRQKIQKLTDYLSVIAWAFYQRYKLSQNFVIIKLLRIVDLPHFIDRLIV